MIEQKAKGYAIPPSMQDIPKPPRRQRNEWSYQAYRESDVWKCPKSPTGAHHWKGTVLLMKCIHCGEQRVPDQNTGRYYPWKGERKHVNHNS